MEEASAPLGKKCLKCGHQRTAADTGPDWACPACGAVYAKVEAALAAREAAAARQATPVPAPAAPALPLGTGDDEITPELAQYRAAARGRAVLAHIVYALYLVPFGTALVGIVIAHVAASNRSDSWVDSHFAWQVRTFWISLLGGIVLLLFAAVVFGAALFGSRRRGAATAAIVGSGGGIAFAVGLLVLSLWVLYRIVKGWYRLVQEEEVE